ncbi:hypothetical protein EWM60_06920, partial [Candidatus Erwinia dacicola]|nr:hypothetical protein [Candidatus Erwinia dacicola]
LIQLAEGVANSSTVEVDLQALIFTVQRGDKADIAVIHVAVVVVFDLHDLVAHAEYLAVLFDTVVNLVKTRLPRKFNVDAVRDIQVLCPMNRGITGARGLNQALQAALNTPGDHSIEKYGQVFSVGDKVMQIENNYDRDVYNGDIGFVAALDREDESLQVNFDGRAVSYPLSELDELSLCYATTIHKSQGSEYPVVIIPLSTQHYMMLRRNLIYTGVTRGKRLVVLVGQKRALGMAIRDRQTRPRCSKLRERLAELPR